MAGTRISIVIPTRNGARTLPALLDAVARQRIDMPVDVIAVDSASTDETVAILRDRVDEVVSIPADAFDHGTARNLGIERSRGDLVVLMVQDALPASEDWLFQLTNPLLSDDRLAGTFARQRPRDDASAITRYYLQGWLAASEKPRRMTVSSRAEFDALSPMDRFQRCVFDNVCSCIRRSVWEKYPFRSTVIAEDVEWAREVLLAGHQLAYVPAAVVFHSHERPASYEFERTYALHRRLFELFGLRAIPSLASLFRSIASSLALHWRCQHALPAQSRHARDAFRAIALAFAWPCGQYFGALAAIRGWSRVKSRRV